MPVSCTIDPLSVELFIVKAFCITAPAVPELFFSLVKFPKSLYALVTQFLSQAV